MTDEFTKNFEEKGIENLKIMEESGFLKKQGYSKGSGWKLVAVILGILFLCIFGFIGYQISEGKFKLTANPNLLCESQVCELTCPEQSCNCGNITCETPIVNITINPLITAG